MRLEAIREPTCGFSGWITGKSESGWRCPTNWGSPPRGAVIERKNRPADLDACIAIEGYSEE
jgi:hypothetical protein